MIFEILQTVGPFLILGFILLVMGVVMVFSSKNPNNWPIVEGRITKSNLNFQTEASESTEILKCEPKINYTFEVDGKSFSSEKISSDNLPVDRVLAQEIVDSYPSEKAVDVYYNPKNPEESFLLPKKNSIGLIFLISGFAILATSITYLIYKLV